MAMTGKKMCAIIHAIRPQRLCTGNCIGMQNLRKMLPAATSPPPTHGVWAWIGKVIIIHSAGVENHLSYLTKQLNCSEYSLIPIALGASLCLYRKAYVTQRVTSQTISRPNPNECNRKCNEPYRGGLWVWEGTSRFGQWNVAYALNDSPSGSLISPSVQKLWIQFSVMFLKQHTHSIAVNVTEGKGREGNGWAMRLDAQQLHSIGNNPCTRKCNPTGRRGFGPPDRKRDSGWMRWSPSRSSFAAACVTDGPVHNLDSGRIYRPPCAGRGTSLWPGTHRRRAAVRNRSHNLKSCASFERKALGVGLIRQAKGHQTYPSSHTHTNTRTLGEIWWQWWWWCTVMVDAILLALICNSTPSDPEPKHRSNRG